MSSAEEQRDANSKLPDGANLVDQRLVSLRLEDFITPRYHIRQAFNAYFAVYVFKILCEIWKGTFAIYYIIFNPYTAKYIFY